MKDRTNQWENEDRGGERPALGDVVFDFEDTGDSLSLLPLSARRALDVAGFRLSLEGWQSLSLADRRELAIEGGRDAVDASTVELAVKRSALPATRIRPVPDPDPLLPPEQLSSFLGPRRAIDPAQWARLRALDRYALIHVLRRSIAHDDPIRLEAALGTILPRAPGRSAGPDRSPRAPRSPSPSPRSPKRVVAEPVAPRGQGVGGASTGSTARRSETPSTDRRPPPITSRSESPPLRDVGRNDGVRGGQGVGVARGRALESDPPRGRVAARSDIPSSLAASTSRTQRDTLDSADRALSEARARPRAFQELDDLDHRASVDDPDSLPGLDSDPPAREPFSTHVSDDGEVRMVDVGEKPATARRATARGLVEMRRETARRIVESDVPKGDVLSAARIAGIMAAKRTPELIPLCHHVALTKVEVQVDIDPDAGVAVVLAVVEARDRTGVEMEALAAVTAACLTIYDMLKGVDRDMVLSDIKLLEKSGGRTGNYVRRDD